MPPRDFLKLPGSDELSLESMSLVYDPHQVMGTKSM